MSRRPAAGHGARDRWAVASRVLAASVGGYAAAALLSSALALGMVRWGGVSRADAVLWTSLGSFALYTAVAVAVFAARSATRAWWGLCAVALPCALLLWRWQA